MHRQVSFASLHTPSEPRTITRKVALINDYRTGTPLTHKKSPSEALKSRAQFSAHNAKTIRRAPELLHLDGCQRHEKCANWYSKAQNCTAEGAKSNENSKSSWLKA